MKNIKKIISHLRDKDIKITVKDGCLFCNAPKGALTPELRSQLLKHKSELIEFIEKATTSLQPAIEHVPTRSQYDNIPLSFSQERLWFLYQLSPDIPFYNMSEALHLKGLLNTTTLKHTLTEIFRRHEILRTVFDLIDGCPIQKTLSSFDLPLLEMNLQHGSQIDNFTEIQELIAEETQRPFNLKKGPLIKIILFKLNIQEHVLFVVMHHIIADVWSMGVFIQEFIRIYQSFSAGKPSPLLKLPIQYADFAIWQRQWLTTDILEKHLSYWKQQLKNCPSTITLPIDRPRKNVQTFNGSSENVIIGKDLIIKLREFSLNSNTTLFMTILSVFAILLFRYSGQDDIVIGSPIANRNKHETESLIGFFVNMLSLRINLAGNPTFQELLSQVRQVTLDAYEHQDLPFEKIVEELHQERKLSRTPIFQVVFAFQNVPIGELKLDDLDIIQLEVETFMVRYDLEFYLWEDSEGMKGYFKYNTDLFNRTTIQRMLQHFNMLLTKVVENPEQQVELIPMITKAERQQLLVEWNDTKAYYPHNKCIHQLFEEQVERSPDAVAVVFEDQTLTYRELNSRSNQLANYLQSLGVGPEVLVGICVERSLEMVIGLLGILKAGGAYVPIDPSYPEERIDYIIKDTGVDILLTQTRLIQENTSRKLKIFYLDDRIDLLKFENSESLNSKVAAGNLAYIMYTSGSTGKPKGVCIMHQGVVRLVKGVSYASFNPEEVFFQHSSISFDASTFEIWGCLLNGAKLAVMTEGKYSFSELKKYIKQYNVTTLWLTASLFNVIVDENVDELHGVNQLIVGGEVLSVPHVRKAIQELKDCLLINGYGPTESTTFACCFPISNQSDISMSVPIGHPINNTKVYILDQHLHPTPIGVIGDLYIGGDGLARGYLNRPGLTDQKFIPNPFSEKQGDRIYKTGDLARYLNDGNIDFIGRHDNQIKIRGYRVELGEIEATLKHHPGISDVAVTLKGIDLSDNKDLIAYVVPNKKSVTWHNIILESQNKFLSNWEDLFNRTISESTCDHDPSFNITGWNSSYTGLPFSEEEMHEWVKHTVERILLLKPNHVLEIGCGTGLLLSKIAPYCKKYWGTDFSRKALRSVEQLKKSRNDLEHVALLHRMADNFEDIESESFDIIILNSVVQYFPNIQYVVRLLSRAIDVVEPNGFIFIGDIRNFQLLYLYQFSILFFQSPGSLSLRQLQQRIEKNISQENELLIAPEFFIALKNILPKISHVSIMLKRGYHHNELTKYRYDVILHIGDNINIVTISETSWTNWQINELSLQDIRQQLIENQPEVFGLRGVKNARIHAELNAMELLHTEESKTNTIKKLKETQTEFQNYGLDPEDIWKISDDLNYSVNISWINSSKNGDYDILFKRSSDIETYKTPILFYEENYHLKPWSYYANDPLLTNSSNRLILKLRQYLKDKLPDYMLPSFYMILETLPLTANGKLNRDALPIHDNSRIGLETSYVSPNTPLENILAKIWTEELNIDDIGIYDNFFDLGGHSLKATVILSRIHKELNTKIPIAQLFNKPTIKGLSEYIEISSQNIFSSIEQAERKEYYALSSAQKRLFILNQMENINVTYNLPQVFIVKEKIDKKRLEKAFRALINRHESLRTSFEIKEEIPCQIINEKVNFEIRTIETNQNNEDELKRLVSKCIVPFDLSKAPLLRLIFIKAPIDRNILVFDMHHIISDGVSMSILIRDLIYLYSNKILPALRLQYKDYSVFQYKILESEEMKKQKRYWLNKFSDQIPILDLPTDYPRPTVQSFKGDSIKFKIESELTRKLYRLVKETKTTLYILLLAAYNVLLSKYTKQEDIIIGSPIAGRYNDDLKNIVGMFVNTLAIRNYPKKNKKFKNFLLEVKSNALEIYENQNYPFDELVSKLKIHRSSKRNPLFDVMFVLQNTDSVEEFQRLNISYFEFENMITHFDLHLEATEIEDTIRMRLEFSTVLFKRETVKKMTDRYVAILKQIIDKPDIKLENIVFPHDLIAAKSNTFENDDSFGF